MGKSLPTVWGSEDHPWFALGEYCPETYQRWLLLEVHECWGYWRKRQRDFLVKTYSAQRGSSESLIQAGVPQWVDSNTVLSRWICCILFHALIPVLRSHVLLMPQLSWKSPSPANTPLWVSSTLPIITLWRLVRSVSSPKYLQSWTHVLFRSGPDWKGWEHLGSLGCLGLLLFMCPGSLRSFLWHVGCDVGFTVDDHSR